MTATTLSAVQRLALHARVLTTMSAQKVPEWKTLLDESLSENPKFIVYSLSTLDEGQQPRVRTVVHRDIISLTPSRPLLISTTDVRMAKVGQLTRTTHNFELAWWIESSGEQYRISGLAHILPAPSNPLHASFPFARLSPPSNPIDWEAERLTTYTDKVGGHIRAGFCGPPPGSPIGSYDDMKAYPSSLCKPGEEKNEKEREWTEKALGNFCLMVIEPKRVEYLELKRTPNRRTVFSLKGEHEWERMIVAP